MSRPRLFQRLEMPDMSLGAGEVLEKYAGADVFLYGHWDRYADEAAELAKLLDRERGQRLYRYLDVISAHRPAKWSGWDRLFAEFVEERNLWARSNGARVPFAFYNPHGDNFVVDWSLFSASDVTDLVKGVVRKIGRAPLFADFVWKGLRSWMLGDGVRVADVETFRPLSYLSAMRLFVESFRAREGNGGQVLVNGEWSLDWSWPSMYENSDNVLRQPLEGVGAGFGWTVARWFSAGGDSVLSLDGYGTGVTDAERMVAIRLWARASPPASPVIELRDPDHFGYALALRDGWR